MYPRLRPHWLQRRTTRDLNFGTRRDRIITDFRAISFYLIVGAVLRRIRNLLPNNPAHKLTQAHLHRSPPLLGRPL